MEISIPLYSNFSSGLCSIFDITNSGSSAKIMIATDCLNSYISKSLYSCLELCEMSPIPKPIAETVEYLRLADAEAGIVKTLPLPGYALDEVHFIVTPDKPAYDVDMILGKTVLSRFKDIYIDVKADTIIFSL